MTERPKGSNADEWHLFLCELLDNRAAYPFGRVHAAVQIAEAIDAAREESRQEERGRICQLIVDASRETVAEDDAHALCFELVDAIRVSESR